ncbi:hypothetical protein V8E55_008327 [Tylopilus felleus]
MAQCSALNSALHAKGFNNAELANKTGLGSQRVNDILDGKAKPTQEEFNTIAGVLGITGSVSNQSHSTPIVY